MQPNAIHPSPPYSQYSNERQYPPQRMTSQGQISEHPPSEYNGLKKSLPEKEEWGLIYKQTQEQSELLARIEHSHVRQQQRQMKETLDRQVQQRKMGGSIDVQYDQHFKQYTIDNVRKLEAREVAEVEWRRQKRRQMEDMNMHNLHLKERENIHKSYETKVADRSRLGLDIGVHSEMLRMRKVEEDKKMLTRGLETQFSSQQQQNLNELKQEFNKFQKDDMYMQNQHEKRVYVPITENEGANRVYGLYSNIVRKERNKAQDQQSKIRQDQQRLRQESFLRDERKRQVHESKRSSLKETLEHQVQQYNFKAKEQTKHNPEQEISYTLFSNLNRQPERRKPSPEHISFLQKQVEQQKAKNLKNKYMSEEEYRLNMNQLNKAVNGRYAHDEYQDRSINGIGERLKRYNRIGSGMHGVMGWGSTELIKSHDQDAVRKRLEQISYKQKNYGPGDFSHSNSRVNAL